MHRFLDKAAPLVATFQGCPLSLTAVTPTTERTENKVWFVTGSSRGLGRNCVEAALSRGDKVAATARNTERLDDLVAAHGDAVLPLELDVTDKAAVFESVKRAKEHFGRLDVIVNNAGYGLFGAVEETIATSSSTGSCCSRRSLRAPGACLSCWTECARPTTSTSTP